LGVLAGLLGRGDVVLVDALAHASLHDGCRLSRADVWRFRHNDLAHLEHHLRTVYGRPTLVVVDGVYSMDGDLADLPGICRLAKAYGARILVDDAHGFGVLGPNGRGTCEHFGLLDEVDLISITFSKALGTIGGAVLGDRDVIGYLKHRSRPYVFSAALPPGTVAATHAALKRTMGAPALRRQLFRNVDFLRRELTGLGYRLGPSASQIIPVLIGDDDLALRAGTQLLDEGVFVATVVSPGVPPGQARLRVSPMASHTRADLQSAISAFARVGARLGLISSAGSQGLEGRVPQASASTISKEVPCLDMI
ncbi:MAG TPA: pyridoxal phosphate-dependent aminotransferase family protein, partial [Oscillatoriaceae cyanobacterium]